MKNHTHFVMAALAAVLFIGRNSQASGNETGNGGDVVVCRDHGGQIVSLEVLDLYEARTLRGIVSDLGDPTEAWEGKATRLLGELARVDTDRSAGYIRRVRGITADSLFLPGVELRDISDSMHIAIPAGCAIVQAVIQKQKRFPEDKTFTFSKDIWDRLDESNRAALVMHEVIYEELISSGQTNSIVARYYNSYVCSRKIGLMKLDEYIRFLKNLKAFRELKIGSFFFDPRTVSVAPHGEITGKLARATTYPPKTGQAFYPGYNVTLYPTGEVLAVYVPVPVRLGKGFVMSQARFYKDGSLMGGVLAGAPATLKVMGCEVSLPPNSDIEFYENGILQAAYGAEGELFEISLCDPSVLVPVSYRMPLRFYSNGQLESGELMNPTEIEVDGEKVFFQGHVEFYMNHIVRSGKISGTRIYNLKTTWGERRPCAPGSVVNFDEFGHLRIYD